MAQDIGKMVSGLVLMLVGVFVGYTIFNSLFTPTNTASSAVNVSLTNAGYASEGALVIQGWKLYLMAIPLALMAGAIWYIINAFKSG